MLSLLPFFKVRTFVNQELEKQKKVQKFTLLGRNEYEKQLAEYKNIKAKQNDQ